MFDVLGGEDMRVVIFCFRPGQEMEGVEVAPSVVLYAVAGNGFFIVGKKEYPVEPGDLVVVERKQAHGIRAGRMRSSWCWWQMRPARRV